MGKPGIMPSGESRFSTGAAHCRRGDFLPYPCAPAPLARPVGATVGEQAAPVAIPEQAAGAGFRRALGQWQLRGSLQQVALAGDRPAALQAPSPQQTDTAVY